MDTTEVNDRIVQAIDAVMNLRESTPDDMPHTAPRNRLTMALMHLEDARDAVSAAKDRYEEARRKVALREIGNSDF